MNKATYYSSLSSEPMACEITLSEDKIYIYFKTQNRNMLIWDLKSLRSCVFNGNNLNIVKDEFPGQSLECTGEFAEIIYQAYLAPRPEVIPARPKKVIAFFTVCAIAIIGLVVLAFVYLVPWIAGKATVLVSEDLEIKLGNNLSEAYLKDGTLNDSATFYANSFVEQLNLATKYPIHIYVLESDEINAFAVPGGNIFVYSGLLNKMTSYEEFAALLGHEATHVIKRHSLKSIVRSAASGILIAYFLGDINGFSGWVVSQADEFKQLDYSRELETEADQNGLQLMIKNEVSPKGMLDLLKVLKKESAEMPGMMKYFSTHPDTDARIEEVLKEPLIGRVFPENEKLKMDFITIKKKL